MSCLHTGEFQVQLQPPVNRQAVPLHAAAAAVPSPAAAGVGAAAPLKTSSAATAASSSRNCWRSLT